MDKFKKIDKEFLLTDSSVNCFGYRLLTSGYLMAEFQKNPIGYYMHERENGVLVKWDNLRMDGDQVFGKPCINLSNPRGQQTVDEIESGFLNAASFGHFIVLDATDTDKLSGQTGPTVTKWYNRECSLVDIPGNFNALKDLFDENNNPLNLENLKSNFIKMKQVFLTAEQLGKMNLKADVADTAAVDTAIDNLVAEAAKVPTLVQDLAAANSGKKAAEDALTALKAETVGKEVDAIHAEALAAKKGTKEFLDNLKADYATNPKGFKALVDKLPAFVSITSELKGDVKDLSGKTWDELDKEGKLPELKAKDLELFKTKYKDRFQTEYKG